MKANRTSLFYITLLFIGALSVSCSNHSKDKVAAFEDIRPDYKKKEITSRTNQDTLLPYLTKYINDSVGLVFDSIQLDTRLHFLDRFSNGKKPNRTHFELSNSLGKTFVGEWKFKDTLARKNALFNWLDHFGPDERQITWFGRRAISSENMLILINKTSIIQVNSASKLDVKKWMTYQRYSYPKDSTILIIEQAKGKLCRWTIPQKNTK
ncbi:MAG: hypothetical protein RLZZ382_1185 [Bacteroidota bacterium]|jgi:hypothetical protein